jgi:hypothetical protein
MLVGGGQFQNMGLQGQLFLGNKKFKAEEFLNLW